MNDQELRLEAMRLAVQAGSCDGDSGETLANRAKHIYKFLKEQENTNEA